ncbi:unnamed protein product [Calypogeia fissa]
MASASALLMTLFAVFTLASAPINLVHGCGINIVNSCPYEVTTCAQSDSATISQYNLGSGATQYLDFGSACQWPNAAIWASVTGQCAVSGSPTVPTDRDLADLAEFNIGTSTGDYYDISTVEAYNIGLSIAVTSVGVQHENAVTPCYCCTSTCVISNISSFCQGDNVLITEASGALVCKNTDGAGGISPTPNTVLFKTACPDAYSYPDDGATSLYSCSTGSIYQVTICPGGITTPATNQSLDLDQ